MTLISPKRTPFALLDKRTTKSLKALQAVQRVSFRATILSALAGGEPPGVNATPKVSINIYGSKASIDQVGTLLTVEGQFLQHPFLLEHGVEYHNPQFLITPGTRIGLGHHVKNRYYGASSKERISSEVTTLLESLDMMPGAAESPEIDQLQTPLLSWVFHLST